MKVVELHCVKLNKHYVCATLRPWVARLCEDTLDAWPDLPKYEHRRYVRPHVCDEPLIERETVTTDLHRLGPRLNYTIPEAFRANLDPHVSFRPSDIHWIEITERPSRMFDAMMRSIRENLKLSI